MSKPTIVSARSIGFVTPLIRAVLAGRKTQTRRLIKPQPDCIGMDSQGVPVAYASGKMIRCRFGRPGDHLWVQERWTDQAHDAALFDSPRHGIIYAADLNCPLPGRWKPARFMPRRHSRLTLMITAVRLERLNQITRADAVAEGFDPAGGNSDALAWFQTVWDQLSDESSCFNANPWVWVIQFQLMPPSLVTAV